MHCFIVGFASFWMTAATVEQLCSLVCDTALITLLIEWSLSAAYCIREYEMQSWAFELCVQRLLNVYSC